MRDMPVANGPFIETNSAHSAASPRWLSIVGIGEDGVDGLSAAARGLIGGAEIVFGGRRHLALAAPLIRGASRAWPSPFDSAAEAAAANRRRLRRRRLGAAGQRYNDFKIDTFGQALGQFSRFRRTAEDKDA